MMTREEVLSIEEYCAEHRISHKKRLEEDCLCGRTLVLAGSVHGNGDLVDGRGDFVLKKEKVGTGSLHITKYLYTFE